MSSEEWAALRPLVEIVRRRGERVNLVLKGEGIVCGKLTAWTEDGRVFIEGREYRRIGIVSFDFQSELEKRTRVANLVGRR